MMLRRAWLVMLVYVLPPSALLAQARMVMGVVVDSAGSPIFQAQIFTPQASRIVETARDGRFRLSFSGTVNCEFEVMRSGHAPARVRLEPCVDTTLQVVLRRRPPGSSPNQFGARCGTRSSQACTDRDGIRFIAVSSGQVHSCGISVDSAAYCWGDGRNGQLGTGARDITRMPSRVLGTTRFASIAAGGAFSCARTSSGEVHCWGSERTVPGWPHQPEGPVRVMLDRPAASLAVGRRHACALDAEGQASCWGWNVDGETGIGVSGLQQSMVPRPTRVETEARFASLSAGLGFTCGVTTEGAVMCWGSNIDYILGETAPERCGDVGSIPCSSRPVNIPAPERIAQLSAGAGHACALGARENVYCWGANSAGQAGVFRSKAQQVRTPTMVELPVQGRIVSLSSGGIQTCALTSTRAAYCWGADNLNYGQDLEQVENLAPRLAGNSLQLKSISVGQVHACGLEPNGRLRCWGDTILGALGIR